jgi:hypothetical protein
VLNPSTSKAELQTLARTGTGSPQAAPVVSACQIGRSYWEELGVINPCNGRGRAAFGAFVFLSFIVAKQSEEKRRKAKAGVKSCSFSHFC